MSRRLSSWLACLGTAVLALAIFGRAACAGESGAETAARAVGENPDAPVDSLGALRTAWESAPEDIGSGLRYQDAMRAAGRARTAQAEFRKMLSRSGASPALAFLHGRIAGGPAGLKAMRAALAERLGRSTGDESGLLEAWIALVVMEVSAGNAEEAASAGTAIVRMRGGAADWTYLGWIQEHMLDDDSAAGRSYEAALKADSEHLPARNALCLLKAVSGDVKGARTIAEDTVRKNPADASSHLHLGLVLALAGEKDAARRCYTAALLRSPQDSDALTSVASAYMDIEQHELAERALERALKLSPDNVRALSTAGLLAMAQGDTKAARAYLKRAGKVAPKDARIAFLGAVCAERLGLQSSAITGYKRAMSLDRDRVEYVSALAMALRKKGSLSTAVQKFKQGIKMAPKDADLYLQLGITLMQQRKYRPACDAFATAARLAPKDPRPHFYLAIIYGDRLSKPKGALVSLERYEKLGGKEPTALSWLAELRASHSGG